MTKTLRLKTMAGISVSNVDKRTVDGHVAVKLCNYIDVYYNSRITSSLPFMQATATEDQLRKFSLRCGDVLITKDSEAPDDIAVPALVTEDLPGIVCGYHLAMIRATSELVVGPYLYWALSSSLARHYYAVSATGVTRFGLRTESLGDLRISVPSRAEQCSIVDFLDRETARIDELMAAKRRLAILLETRQKAELEARCWGSQQSPVQLRRLITRIVQGWSPDCFSRPAEEHEWGVLKAGSVKPLAFDPNDNKALPDEQEPRPELVIHRDDLLVNRASGSVDLAGSVAIAEKVRPQLLLCDKVFRLEVHPGVSKQFLMYTLASPSTRRFLEARLTGNPGTAYNLAQDVLMATPIPNLDTHDQQALARDLDASGRLYRATRARIERQVEVLAEHRQALITAAVTGQLEIPGATA